MRALILGAGGMVGHKVFRAVSDVVETWGTFRSDTPGHAPHPYFAGVPRARLLSGVDLTRDGTIEALFESAAPDLVINCAGIVKQVAGDRREACIALNALFPQRLARLCAERGARLIQISTDCVFSGNRSAYRESDTADASDLYGRTKYLGEVAGPGMVTLRTSFLGRELTSGHSLLEWFFAAPGPALQGYTKARFSGWPTVTFAGVVRDLVRRGQPLSGLYHVAAPPISKYDLLVRLRDAYRPSLDITPSDEVTCDRTLDGSRFSAATGLVAPSWDRLIEDLTSDPTPYDDWKRHDTTA